MKRLILKILKKLGYDLIKIQHPKDDRNIYYKKFSDGFKCYNLGGGRNVHPLWINIDLSDNRFTDKADIEHDFESLNSFPVKNNSADAIYSSHCIEHLTNNAVDFLLIECHRILKKGGILRLTCPNIDLDYYSYVNRDYSFFKEYMSIFRNHREDLIDRDYMSIHQLFLYNIASNITALNKYSDIKYYDDEIKIMMRNEKEVALNFFIKEAQTHWSNINDHINWFNHKKLYDLLIKSGFNTIYVSGQNQSFIEIMRNPFYFDTNTPKKSLFMEVIK